MIRATILTTLAAVLMSCTQQGPTSPVTQSIPSGSEAPRTTLTVISGTKAAPVDTPVVNIAWVHHSSEVTLALSYRRSLNAPLVLVASAGKNGEFLNWGDSVMFAPLSLQPIAFSSPSGNYSFKVTQCRDSILVSIGIVTDESPYKEDSTWVYCKH